LGLICLFVCICSPGTHVKSKSKLRNTRMSPPLDNRAYNPSVYLRSVTVFVSLEWAKQYWKGKKLQFPFTLGLIFLFPFYIISFVVCCFFRCAFAFSFFIYVYYCYCLFFILTLLFSFYYIFFGFILFLI